MSNATTHGAGPAGTGAPRRLVRTPDGKIAGVAAGIGHYLGVDPTIVRIAFLVLVFAGGVGILLYLASWIVMPKGEAAAPTTATPVDPWTAIGIVGLVAGVGLLVGWHGIGDLGRVAVAVALVIGGVLLIGRTTGGEPGGGSAGTPAPPGPAPPAGDAGDGPAAGDAPTEAPSGPEPAPPPADTITTTRTEAAAPVRDARAPVTLLVLGLLGIGLAAVLTDALDLGWSAALAALLVVVGAGLAFASTTGGAPWLFPIGVVATGALLVAAVLEPLDDRGVGEREFSPVLAAEVAPEYRHGIGHLVVDLGSVALQGERTVSVRLGIGRIEVTVPPDAEVQLDGHVGAGRLEGPDGREVDGLDRDLDGVFPGAPGGGRLELDLDLGIGEAVIRRG